MGREWHAGRALLMLDGVNFMSRTIQSHHIKDNCLMGTEYFIWAFFVCNASVTV